jgi:gas vesicle protein
MENHKGQYSRTALLVTFVGGAVLGAIAGVLLTDRSGQETRWELEDYAKRKQRDLMKKAKEVRAALDDVIERGRNFMTEKRAGIESPMTTDREPRKESVVARIK